MPAADIVLKNARVITLNTGQTTAELVAITGDEGRFVGLADLPLFGKASWVKATARWRIYRAWNSPLEDDPLPPVVLIIYGDGSQNKFRYALDDNVDPNDNFQPGEYHEVSRWITIDWMGWKLISWDLTQGETGTWLGDGNLDGTLRFDSFQLTHEQGNALSGAIYFKNLRLIKKEISKVKNEQMSSA